MSEMFIVMTDESVRLLASGRKTQTRRIMKPQPRVVGDPVLGPTRWGWVRSGTKDRGTQVLTVAEAALLSPVWGRPGDTLRVKETHSVEALTVYPCPSWCWYKADFDPSHYDPRAGEHIRGCAAKETGLPDGACIECAMNGAKFRWRSPRFMSRRMSRFTLEITEVRVQQLKDITDEDALAEGCQEQHVGSWRYSSLRIATKDQCMTSPRLAYANAWNRLHGGARWNLKPGPCPWDENPWVWAISFRRVS